MFHIAWLLLVAFLVLGIKRKGLDVVGKEGNGKGKESS